MENVLYLTEGPGNLNNGERTKGYRVTLTLCDNGHYKCRWDYPRDPHHPSIGSAEWSLAEVQDNLKQGIWMYVYPPVLNLPRGT